MARHDDRSAGGDLGERVVAGRVERIAVIPQLHRDAVTAERVDETLELTCRGGGAVRHECRWHRAFATPGEHPPVPRRRVRGASVRSGELGERRAGRTLLPRHLRPADRPTEPGVPARPGGEHDQMCAFGIGHPVRRARRAEGELGAEHRRQADRARRLREADDSVEAVVVGECEGFETEPSRFLHELFGMAGAVEEAEVRVAVQLRVRHRVRRALELRRRAIGLAPARPSRAVAAGVGPRRRAWCSAVRARGRRAAARARSTELAGCRTPSCESIEHMFARPLVRRTGRLAR